MQARQEEGQKKILNLLPAFYTFRPSGPRSCCFLKSPKLAKPSDPSQFPRRSYIRLASLPVLTIQQRRGLLREVTDKLGHDSKVKGRRNYGRLNVTPGKDPL